MAQTEEFDIFNLDDSQMSYQEEKKTKKVYSPKPSDGSDNTFSSVIRFIANPKDPYNQSILKKVSYWIEAPELGLKGYFDSPTSIGDKNCPISKKYWELKNASDKGDNRAKNALERLGTRKEMYFSYVYVVTDTQNKDLEGKIVIFRYNKTIKKLIDSQKNPPAAVEGMEEEPSCEVFNLLTGKNFLLKITKQGEYPNYDGCKFAKNVTPLKIGDKLITDKEAKAEFKTLIESRPDIYEHEYREWNDEESEKISKYLNSLSGSAINSYNDLNNDVDEFGEPVQQTKKSTPKKEEKKVVPADDFEDDFDEKPKPTAKKEEKTVAKKAEKKAAPAPAGDDDLDDFLNGI